MVQLYWVMILKKRVAILLTMLIIVGISFLGYKYFNYKKELKEIEAKEKLAQKLKLDREKLKKSVEEHYNKYVKTTKETKLYINSDNSYIEYGIIGSNVEIELNNVDITYKTEYFPINGMDCYVYYKDVEKIEELTKKSNSYKKYVPFNENVITNEHTSLYDDNGLVYKINKGVNLPIIIKDSDKYYVEFNNKLLYINKEDSSTVKNKNTTAQIRNNIRTLTYHFIYKKGDYCVDPSVCTLYETFDSQMKYLSDNDYFTMTLEDLELFLDGKIQIPKKSIVITLDDGAFVKNAVEIVEKNKVNATMFIITSIYDVSNIKSEYMNFQSHTDNLHNNYKCKGGNQGGQLLCEKESVILEDLKTSQKKLGGSFALAYPFFDFNERAIKILKQAGFRLAFVGQYDTNGYSTQKTNKMKIRRKTMYGTINMTTFVNYLT